MITTIPPFPALSDRADNSYNSKAFNWASHMANVFPSEVNALVANLNSIAAGGAYAFPYTWKLYDNVNTPTGGLMAIQDASYTAAGAPHLYLDYRDAAGREVLAALSEMDDSTSAIRGKIRVISINNPSAYALYDVIGPSVDLAYGRAVRVQCTLSSAPNPFNYDGEAVMLYFQRTGDKGDTGVAAAYPYAYFAEQYSSGTSGPATGTNVVDRALNATLANNIPGLSLSGGAVTWPAGTYEVRAISLVAGNAGTRNQAIIYNVTDGVPLIAGTSDSNGGNNNIISHASGRFVIASPKTIKLRTWIGNVASTFGNPAGSGYAETYASLEIWKIG